MAFGTDQRADTGGAMPPVSARVWDRFVRIIHWSLVAAFAAAFLSAEAWNRLHEWTGYAAAGLVAARIIWGFVGTRHARFSDFVAGPRAVAAYLGAMARMRERRHLGHNPAGGAMILALLAGVLGLGATGYLMSLDAFWGLGWIEDLHETIANVMLLLVALHIAGVVVASIRHGENLALAMLTGRKKAE